MERRAFTFAYRKARCVFFATVQNKMHWAAHGHTAAELVALRTDAKASNMGLTSWTGASKGGAIRKADVSVANNYLNEDELGTLNRIVTASCPSRPGTPISTTRRWPTRSSTGSSHKIELKGTRSMRDADAAAAT